MASKLKSLYVCSQCGYESAKWYGKCPSCGEWNTFTEEIRDIKKTNTPSVQERRRPSSAPVPISQITTEDEQRYYTGSGELDRVLGGGIVKGSLVLLGGDPGIGKSTILLQICSHLGKILKILYISGEESKRQIKLRAARLGVESDNLYIMTETDIEIIADQIQNESPDLVMIDSIQTMNYKELNSSPGSVTQVRECTNILMRTSKSLDIPCIVVGHVNKDGAIAGPKVLEHIVDAVLYFEGDKQMSYRILRAVKNRYGSTNEIGVFQMGDTGLTGRKIIVDTYGGYARHGGGCFSGKDPSKVDRSGAYAARYVAKNIVAAGLARRCEIQVSYAIGVAEPTSISVDTFGTGKVSDEKLSEMIRRHFDLRPYGIIEMLDLLRPIYKQTAAYGHFGRSEFPWESTDRAEELKEDAGV